MHVWFWTVVAANMEKTPGQVVAAVRLQCDMLGPQKHRLAQETLCIKRSN